MANGEDGGSIPTPPELEVKAASDRIEIVWMQRTRSYRLTLDRTALTIQSDPKLFEPKNRYSVPVSAIEGVFVVERAIGRYELHLVDRSRRSSMIPTEIFGGDLEFNMARYFEMTIERFLDLEIKHVAGETEIEPRYRFFQDQLKPPFWIWDSVSQYSEGILAGSDQERSTVVMPEGFDVMCHANAMAITCPRKKNDGVIQWVAWLGLPFAGFILWLVWDAGNFEAFVAFVISLLVLFIFLQWKAVPHLFRYRIAVDADEMLIAVGPSLIQHKERIETKNVSQLYVAEYVREALMPYSSGPPVLTYHLMMLGSRQGLIAEFEDAHAALFLEQELERFLNIEDKPVKGELRTKYRW